MANNRSSQHKLESAPNRLNEFDSVLDPRYANAHEARKFVSLN